MTKKKHFRIFKKECKYWIKKFGLTNWKFIIEHRDSKRMPGALAWRYTNWSGRLAVIGLSKDWGDDHVTNKKICRSAFHEVIEIMLSDIEAIAILDICPTQRAELESHIHVFIRIFENTIWKEDYKCR